MLHGFPPIVPARPKVLILGTFPGPDSLRTGEYYAHRRNSFWRLMSALVGLDPDAAYDARVEFLRSTPIALWDVVARCRREGSEDAKIRDPEPANIGWLLDRHPGIRTVAHNGQPSGLLYRRLVLPSLREDLAALPRVVMVSTSPAAARWTEAQKAAHWRRQLGL